MAIQKQEFIKQNDDGSVDITLSRPMDIDGAKVAVLRMREPTVGDQLVADESTGSEAAKEITMLSNLCQVAPDDIKRLKLRDYKRAQVAFLGFLA